MPGAWASAEDNSRDLEQSPVTETEGTHSCSTAVTDKGNKSFDACSMSDDVPVRPATLGAVLQELRERLA